MFKVLITECICCQLCTSKLRLVAVGHQESHHVLVHGDLLLLFLFLAVPIGLALLECEVGSGAGT